MAFDLGAIIARVKADTSDFKKGMNDAKSDLNGFHTQLGKTTGAAKTFVTGLAAVGAGVVAIGTFALKSAAGLEQTKVSFENLLGSQAKANTLMKELSKFAAETPFEFPDLAQSTRLLLAFGDTAENVMPHLRIIGDAVSTMGGGAPEIDRVTRAIGQMAAKGKITAEEMNQLGEIGINGFKLLSKQTGKSEADLRKLSEQGELLAKDMLPKLYDQMAKDYGGGMAKQARTLTGLFSTLKDNVGMFFRDLIGFGQDGMIREGSIFTKIRDGMAALIDWLNANQGAIKDGLKTVFDFIVQYAPIIAGILGTVLVAAFAGAAGAALSFVASMAPLIAIGAALGAAFMLLQPYFGVIGNYIQTTLIPIFQGFIGWLQQLWQGVLPGLMAAWSFLQPAFAQLGAVIVNELWPALVSLWTMLQQLWQQVAPVLIPALQILGTILGVMIVAAVYLVTTALSFVITVISDVINWISSMGSFFAMVINTIIIAVTAAGAFIGAAFTFAVGVAIAIITVLGNTFRAIFNAISATAAFVLNTIGAYWNTLYSVVRQIMSTIAAVVSNIMQGNVQGAFRAALDGVKGIWNTITGFFSGIVSGIIGMFSRVTAGIVAPFRDAVNQIKGLMQGAKDALSNLNPFQRHSPSIVDWVKRGTKVIANEYGDLTNSIMAGTTAARIETLGTARSLANISPAQLNVQAESASGARGGTYIINVEGVLADSVEAKRRFGEELVQVINDGLSARGKDTLPS